MSCNSDKISSVGNLIAILLTALREFVHLSVKDKRTKHWLRMVTDSFLLLLWLQDVRKRKAGLEVKERHGQTCVPGALLVRVDTIQAALSLVRMLAHLFIPVTAHRPDTPMILLVYAKCYDECCLSELLHCGQSDMYIV